MEEMKLSRGDEEGDRGVEDAESPRQSKDAQLIAPYLIVILHQLNDDANVVRIILNGDHPHDVGGIFGVRILTILISQNEASVRFVHLRRVKKKMSIVTFRSLHLRV